MNYEEFEMELYKNVLPRTLSHIRSGQALMGFLFNIWPNEYNRIVFIDNAVSTIDCFYKDSLIPNTLSHLKENWHKYPN